MNNRSDQEAIAKRLRGMLKESGFLVGLVFAARAARSDCARLKFLAGRARVIRSYLREEGTPKLQLGAGRNVLPGWLNTDIRPRSAKVAYLDATRRFPFADQTFHYVFSEHLIEHLKYEHGLHMLRECWRVLRPAGVLRIATPGLDTIVGLIARPHSAVQEHYIKRAVDEHIPWADTYRASFVINNFFWDFRHLFVYDAETLVAAMKSVGFVDVRRHSPGTSDDDNLRGIESHGIQISEEMNRFETMVFEAVRPRLRAPADQDADAA